MNDDSPRSKPSSDAWIQPVTAAPPSKLDMLAQAGYDAMRAALATEDADAWPSWCALPEMERRAYAAFAAAVIAADALLAAEGDASPLLRPMYDEHGQGRPSGPVQTEV